MPNSRSFDLFVFHRNLKVDAAAVAGGTAGMIVDFETLGKSDRQLGFDTQINQHDWEDLREVKQDLGAYAICRINRFNHQSETEVIKALQLGADEILLPMVRTVEEVTSVLELVKDKARLGVMIETDEAVEIAGQLDQLPLARVYVGLNDLRVCRGNDSIFSAMADGTVEKIRENVKQVQFGFGGLTVPGSGAPLPVEHFAHEMTRLDCQFTFLRRSFFKDTSNRCLDEAIPAISGFVASSFNRDRETIRDDQLKLAVQFDRILDAAR